MKRRTILAALGLLLSSSARAGLEKDASLARTSFDAKLALLKPHAEEKKGLRVTGPGGVGNDEGFLMLIPTYGQDQSNAGGVQLVVPAHPYGGSAVVGLTMFGRTAVRDGEQGRQHVQRFAGGPTLGYRQKLGALRLGAASLVPEVTAGWAPFSVERSWERTDDGRRDYRTHWAPVTGYAAAGVSLLAYDSVGIGVEHRIYKDFLGEKSQMRATGITLTYTPSY